MSELSVEPYIECRICGSMARWSEGHGCANATPDNERHRLTLKERDEERNENGRLRLLLAMAEKLISIAARDAHRLIQPSNFTLACARYMEQYANLPADELEKLVGTRKKL